MFVYTMKASGLKFFAVVAVSVAILATVIGVLPSITAAADVANVSTDYKNKELHILGLFIKKESLVSVNSICEEVRKNKDESKLEGIINPKVLEYIKVKGLYIS